MGILGRLLPRQEAAPAARRRRTRALYSPFQQSLPHGDGITLPAAVSARRHRARVPGLLLTAAALAGLAYLMGADRFRAAEAHVTGTQFADEAAVVEASGALGQNILLLDPVKMAASVTGLADIASAEVRLILPDRVAIHLREKEAWAALRIGEEIFPLARDGTVLSQREAGELQVILLSDDSPPISAGTRLDPGILLAAEEYQESLPWVEELAYDPDTGLRLHTPEGHTVLLGGPERTSQKLALLEALRVKLELQAAGPFIIDLRYRRPFLSLAQRDGR